MKNRFMNNIFVFIVLILVSTQLVSAQDEITFFYVPSGVYDCVDKMYGSLKGTLDRGGYLLQPPDLDDEDTIISYILNLNKDVESLNIADITELLGHYKARFAISIKCSESGDSKVFTTIIYAANGNSMQLETVFVDGKNSEENIQKMVSQDLFRQIAMKIEGIIKLERDLEKERRDIMINSAKTFLIRRAYDACISLLDTAQFSSTTKDSLLGIAKYERGLLYYEKGGSFDQSVPMRLFGEAKGHFEKVTGSESFLMNCDREIRGAEYFLESEEHLEEWWATLDDATKKYFSSLFSNNPSLEDKRQLLDSQGIIIAEGSGLRNLEGLKYMTKLKFITIEDKEMGSLKGVERLPILEDVTLAKGNIIPDHNHKQVEDVIRAGNKQAIVID